jgi:hypothetical protein
MRQIVDATTRCRVCASRAKQCALQDQTARRYHCGQLASENNVCKTYNDPQKVAHAETECVSAAFHDYSGGPEFGERSDEGYYFKSVGKYDGYQTQELNDRTRQIEQCMASKKDKIYFCNKYVEQTRGARALAMSCPSFKHTDDRFSPNDDDRFGFCIDLGDQDSKFLVNGQDPVKFLQTQILACDAERVVRTPWGELGPVPHK